MRLKPYWDSLDISTRDALARAAGTTYGHLRNLVYIDNKSCAPALAVSIERESARAVRRWDLRPDDWHRIWPELIGADGAPAVPEAKSEEAA